MFNALALVTVLSIGAQTTLDPRLEAVLKDPARALNNTPKGFHIIALSNFADYCMNDRDLAAEEAKRCLRGLVKIGEKRLPSAFAGNGLYLSHFNIVLGAYKKMVADGKYDALHEKISRHLASGSLRAKTKHVASYPNVIARWPADQTATLYSLHLYDPELAKEPVREFLEYMDRHGTSKKWGLPKSDVASRTVSASLPRGCALSFSVRYMAAFAPEQARALWEKYRDTYFVDLGVVVGLREWPPGVERKADIDSGPIIRGIGVAASALGIGAARAVGDDLTYARLVASAAIAKTMVDAGNDPLGAAIELAGRSVP